MINRTNATIRYSGGTNDLLSVVLLYFKQKSFLELSMEFALTFESYQKNKTKMLDVLYSSRLSTPTKRHFDNLWGSEHITYTTNKDGTISITVSSNMVTLLLFLKDEDAMMIYSEYVGVLGSSVLVLIKMLGIREQYPEAFI